MCGGGPAQNPPAPGFPSREQERSVCVYLCVCLCACLRLFVYVSVWGAVRDHRGRLRALVKRVTILEARVLGLGDQGKTWAVS